MKPQDRDYRCQHTDEICVLDNCECCWVEQNKELIAKGYEKVMPLSEFLEKMCGG